MTPNERAELVAQMRTEALVVYTHEQSKLYGAAADEIERLAGQFTDLRAAAWYVERILASCEDVGWIVLSHNLTEARRNLAAVLAEGNPT